MKKLLLIPAALFCAGAMAQKPEAGTITTEVGLSLSTFNSNVNSFGLNGRYFLNPGLAVNLGFGMFSENQQDNFAENDDGTGAVGTYNNKLSMNMISLGLQKHFAGTEKLSPWVGLGLGFGGGKSSEEGKNSDGTKYSKNYSVKTDSKVSMFSVDLNLGMDYWFANGMFIGVSYSPFSFSSMKEGDETTTENDNGTSTTSVTLGSSMSGISTFNATPVFRFGWRF